MLHHIDPRASRFRLQVHRSPIHGFGVFAKEVIPARQQIIEYTGERITRREALERLKKFWTPGRPKPIYFFRVSRYWDIDGSVGGSGAEFVNHSCSPNLSARRRRGHVFLFSRRNIRAGEELTLDYRFPANSERIPCRCGAPRCRGTINGK